LEPRKTILAFYRRMSTRSFSPLLPSFLNSEQKVFLARHRTRLAQVWPDKQSRIQVIARAGVRLPPEPSGLFQNHQNQPMSSWRGSLLRGFVLQRLCGHNASLQIGEMLIGFLQALRSRRGVITGPGRLQFREGRPLGLNARIDEFARRHTRLLRSLRAVRVDVPRRQILCEGGCREGKDEEK
jgi:hypothetical protein